MNEGFPYWLAVLLFGYSVLVTAWWVQEWFKRVVAEYRMGRLADELDEFRKRKD